MSRGVYIPGVCVGVPASAQVQGNVSWDVWTDAQTHTHTHQDACEGDDALHWGWGGTWSYTVGYILGGIHTPECLLVGPTLETDGGNART